MKDHSADGDIAQKNPGTRESVSYAAEVDGGSLTYLDFDPGWYDCFIVGASAGDLLRWKYLTVTNPAVPPVTLIGALDAPTADTSDQEAESICLAPANAASICIYVESGYRIACTYGGSPPSPLTLYAVKVY